MDILGSVEIIIRLLVTLALAFILGLEREIKNQPAWIRTHILIWVWSCLLMIISILVPEIYNSNINDPWRIAAQVVSWVWFLWAWAIMKVWLNTRWLTTAANIWATAAIWLTIWAWLYTAWIFVTAIIILNLVIISKLKKHIIKPSKDCVIDINVLKKNAWAERIYHWLSKLPINILSKNITEDSKEIKIHIVSRMTSETTIFKLKWQIHKIAKLEKISISENLKQK